MNKLAALALVIASTSLSAAPAAAAPPAEAPWIGLKLKGARVVEVVSPSPAEVAGLEAEDRVLSVDGVAVGGSADIARAVARRPLGEVSVVRVERSGKRLSFAVFLAAKPEADVRVAPAPPVAAEPVAETPELFGDEGVEEAEDVEVAPVAPARPRPPAAVARPADRDLFANPFDSAPAARLPERPRAPSASDRPFGADRAARVPARRAPRAEDDEIAPIDLRRHRGEVVVVEFMATWCSACRASVSVLNAWDARYRTAGLAVLQVSSEDEALLRRHRASAGITTRLYTDPDAALGVEHDVTSLPTFLVLDREGRVRARFVGGGGNLHQIERLFRELLDDGGGDEGGVRF